MIFSNLDGHQGILVRKIAPAIDIDYCHSDKQTTLHVIIHKAQVINFFFNFN